MPAPAAAEAGPRPDADEVLTAACVVEITHVGSLYHDDVMDDAITRRTVESVNARWGNLKAILAGDYLLAKAPEIAVSAHWAVLPKSAGLNFAMADSYSNPPPGLSPN